LIHYQFGNKAWSEKELRILAAGTWEFVLCHL